MINITINTNTPLVNEGPPIIAKSLNRIQSTFLNGTIVGVYVGNDVDRKSGDVDMMQVNMDEWELRFFVNNELYGNKIDTNSNNMYYPAVHTADSWMYTVLLV